MKNPYSGMLLCPMNNCLRDVSVNVIFLNSRILQPNVQLIIFGFKVITFENIHDNNFHILFRVKPEKSFIKFTK